MRTFHLFATGALALVADSAAAADLAAPIAEYRLYVIENTGQLALDVAAFVAAVKAGDVEGAKALYAPTRASYERIEPIAELIGVLDASIDSRADDYELAEQDPEFPGFHRIEYMLWEENSTAGLDAVADRLLADVTELNAQVQVLDLPPEVVVGGAAELMEEVAASKISGEEDRYSHTDLHDFRANLDGSYKIFVLFSPLIDDASFTGAVEAGFTAVGATLDKYREGGGYASYEALTDADRTVLAAGVNTLAEDLSTLRGRLGLD